MGWRQILFVKRLKELSTFTCITLRPGLPVDSRPASRREDAKSGLNAEFNQKIAFQPPSGKHSQLSNV
jgi:hypothetical protein